MKLVPLLAFTDNYIWVIPNIVDGSFVCVDPGDAKPVIDYATQNSMRLTAILLTHHHHDHIGGIQRLIEIFPNIDIYGPLDSRIPLLTRPIKQNQTILIDHYRFDTLHIPGHTSTHICYFEPNYHWLFCGDTLFSGGCGRVFDGTIAQLYSSLQLLKNLPKKTQVYCGHEYTLNNLRFALSIEPQNKTIQKYASSIKNTSCSLPSTLEIEHQINLFLRASDLETFKQLREKKDNFI